MQFLYKYPGTMIEYLDGKVYDFKKVEGHELEANLQAGWSMTTEEAEGKKHKKLRGVVDAGL